MEYKKGNDDHFYMKSEDGKVIHVNNAERGLINVLPCFPSEYNHPSPKVLYEATKEEFEDAIRDTILKMGIYKYLTPTT